MSFSLVRSLVLRKICFCMDASESTRPFVGPTPREAARHAVRDWRLVALQGTPVTTARKPKGQDLLFVGDLFLPSFVQALLLVRE